jgi:hypothetical protein
MRGEAEALISRSGRKPKIVWYRAIRKGMKSMKKAILVALVAMVASSASAALLLYEGFDYKEGALTGQNGGTGFSAGWTTSNNGGLNVVAGSLSYGVLPTTGNSVYGEVRPDSPSWTHRGNVRAANALAASAGTQDYWVSYLLAVNTSAPTWGAWAGWQTGDTGNSWIGKYGSGGPQIGVGQVNNVGGTVATATATMTTYFLVVKYVDTGASFDAYAWVNPTLVDPVTGLDLAVGTAIGTFANAATSLGTANFEITQANETTMDELRIGTNYRDVAPIPEPASILLLVGGLVGAYKLRRRG